MPITHPTHSGRGGDFRFGRAFDAEELVQQEYRQLRFWGSLLSVGLIIGVVVALVAQPLLWPLIALGAIVRVIIAMAKLFYEQVYEIRR